MQLSPPPALPSPCTRSTVESHCYWLCICLQNVVISQLIGASVHVYLRVSAHSCVSAHVGSFICICECVCLHLYLCMCTCSCIPVGYALAYLFVHGWSEANLRYLPQSSTFYFLSQDLLMGLRLTNETSWLGNEPKGSCLHSAGTTSMHHCT